MRIRRAVPALAFVLAVALGVTPALASKPEVVLGKPVSGGSWSRASPIPRYASASGSRTASPRRRGGCSSRTTDRVYAGTKVSDDDGRVRVRTVTVDRAGRDRIEAAGVNLDTGGSCSGRLSFR